jgi:Fe-S-cluster-containing hydrogenase component 2
MAAWLSGLWSADMTEKPRYGDPCNGCGACCQAAPCPLGQIRFQQQIGPCPAIELDGEKVTCGLVANPIAYNMAAVLKFGHTEVSAAAAILVGANQGCDTQAHDEIVDPAAVHRLRTSAMGLKREIISRAKTIWGIK